MKRNQIVLIVIVAALGLMVWSGYHNYKRRKAEQATARQPLAPGTTAPNASDRTVAQDMESDEGLPNLRGKRAPAFKLKNTNGQRVSLADYKGKAVLINFWATWCAPCKVEMPWLIELQKQYQAQGFTVLGISEDYTKDYPDVVKFKAKYGVEYPVLYGDDAVGKAYGGYGGLEFLPTSYYIGRNGKVVEENAGLISKDQIEAHIKQALATAGQ